MKCDSCGRTGLQVNHGTGENILCLRCARTASQTLKEEKMPMNDLKTSLRASYEKGEGMKKLTDALTAGSIAALGLFLWKLTQTSDFTLAFSNLAHQEMGIWILGFVGLFLASFVTLQVWASKKDIFTKVKEQYTRNLRDELAIAKDENETRTTLELEAELRRVDGLQLPTPLMGK